MTGIDRNLHKLIKASIKNPKKQKRIKPTTILNLNGETHMLSLKNQEKDNNVFP